METNQATEHLQVIRTLMERSALYRRALAPIMTYCGTVGIAGGFTGWLFKFKTDQTFVLFWSAVALLALTGAFLLVRRQAFKDAEPFWSPPTRRVAQALVPALFVGCFVSWGVVYLSRRNDDQEPVFFIMSWVWFYGCAIHAAGFFMSRGMRLFGWVFIIAGCILFALALIPDFPNSLNPHLIMGALFGGLHLAYGIYLHFTENSP